MARPVRVAVAGGWYHITARGIERRAIFADARDHAHFLDLLPALRERYGLGKASNRAEARGLAPLAREAVQRRLKQLQDCPWSSYGAYAGCRPAPDWLTTEVLLARSGGHQAYRRYVRQFVARGACPEGLEGLGLRLALGSAAFLEQMKGWVGRVTKEQPARQQVLKRVTVAQVVALVERQRGEAWAEFAQRHGDWGRELVLYLARQRTGLPLKEIGTALGIGEYKTVGKAVERFTVALHEDSAKRRLTKECLRELSLVET